MRIQIRFRNILHDINLENLAHDRMHAAVDRLALHLGMLTVQLTKSGPAEVVCRAFVHVLPDKHLAVECRGTDVIDVVDGAAHKLAQAAERALDKTLGLRHTRHERLLHAS